MTLTLEGDCHILFPRCAKAKTLNPQTLKLLTNFTKSIKHDNKYILFIVILLLSLQYGLSIPHFSLIWEKSVLADQH